MIDGVIVPRMAAMEPGIFFSRKPMNVAQFVASGPGSEFVREMESRNSSSVS